MDSGILHVRSINVSFYRWLAIEKVGRASFYMNLNLSGENSKEIMDIVFAAKYSLFSW